MSRSRFSTTDDPVQSAVADKADLAALRQWHADAAKRAVRAGFDIVYVYAGHGMLPLQMMQTHENQRTDEYGGSLYNRTRLLRELLEVTREAVGDDTAVALRIAVDELDPDSNIRADGEMRDVVESLANLPGACPERSRACQTHCLTPVWLVASVDLWDVCLHSWKNDSQTSRFTPVGVVVPRPARRKRAPNNLLDLLTPLCFSC